MSSLILDVQTVRMRIPPSTQPQAHLKLKPGWKANGEHEAEKVPCPKSDGRSPTSWGEGLGMAGGREVWLAGGGQRNLRVSRTCQGGCRGVCGSVPLPCGLAWSQGQELNEGK